MPSADHLPVTLREPGDRLSAATGISLGLLSATGGAGFLIEPLFSAEADWFGAMVAAGFCAALALVSFWFGAGAALGRRITLAADGVYLARRGLWGWRESHRPWREFGGIAVRQGSVRDPAAERGFRRVWQVVLEHPRREWRIVIGAFEEPAAADACRKRYAGLVEP